MITLSDVTVTEELTELENCIVATRNASIALRFDKILHREGEEPAAVTESEALIEDIKSTIHISRELGLVYFTISSQDPTSLQKTKYYWERMKKRMHDSYMKNKPNDCQFVLSMIHSDMDTTGIVYMIEMANPVFLSLEKGELELAFRPEMVEFGSEYISRDELEYEQTLEREREREVAYEESEDENADTDDSLKAAFNVSDMVGM